jgi:hypothetical protein
MTAPTRITRAKAPMSLTLRLRIGPRLRIGRLREFVSQPVDGKYVARVFRIVLDLLT